MAGFQDFLRAFASSSAFGSRPSESLFSTLQSIVVDTLLRHTAVALAALHFLPLFHAFYDYGFGIADGFASRSDSLHWLAGCSGLALHRLRFASQTGLCIAFYGIWVGDFDHGSGLGHLLGMVDWAYEMAIHVGQRATDGCSGRLIPQMGWMKWIDIASVSNYLVMMD
jgi:hypothetical protein